MISSSALFLLPVRQRAHRIPALLERLGSARVLFILDQNDPQLKEYRELLAGRETLILPEYHTSKKLNVAFDKNPNEPAYGFLGDDLLLPEDPEWSSILASSVPRHGLAFCDDGIHGPRLPTHPVLCGDLVRALGWFAHPCFHHNGIDIVWREIAYAFGGCTYVMDISFSHQHRCLDPSRNDSTYQKADASIPHDQAAGERFLYQGGKDALILTTRSALA